MTHRLMLCGLAAVTLTGCLAESAFTSSPNPTPDPVGSVDVTLDPAVSVDLEPPVPEPEAPYRERRRMDLDQLDASIRAITGGIGWTEVRSGREVNLFVDLAQTLGKPDYLQITEEDLEPSAMFQKFMDDAARTVCQNLMSAESSRPSADRVFFKHAQPTDRLAASPDKVLANLQYLLLRFHGRKLDAQSPELEPWRWLMQSAEHVTDDQPAVWRTLCVGLMTHPDFYTY